MASRRGGVRTRWPRWVYGSGQEPDPRFTLANERTFLAWTRTSLGLVAAGVAIKALAEGRPAHVAAGLLVGLGMLVPAYAAIRWAQSERALRHQRPLPALAPGIALALGLTVAGIILVAAVLA